MRPVTYVIAAGVFVATILMSVAVLDAQQPQKPAAKAVAAATAPVNLNTATAAQLDTLPGIGPATAKRIIEHRQKNGGFRKIEELMNIRGIGEKSFLKLKPLVTVSTEKPDRPTDKQ